MGNNIITLNYLHDFEKTYNTFVFNKIVGVWVTL